MPHGIFPARQELGFTPSTAVRANIDTRTGAGAVGVAIGQAGFAAIELGAKWALIDAKTQLSRSNIDASNRINEYFIELDGNDEPETYGALFESLTTDLTALAPKNKNAARVYNESLAKQMIQLGSQTRNAGKAKLQANAQEVDFLLLQKAKDSGEENDFLKYRTSVIGNLKLGDVYTATEAERLLDNARNEAELIGKKTDIVRDELLALQQEADRDKLGVALNDGSIDFTMINNSSLPEPEQEQWRVRMNTEIERKARGDVIVTNEQVRADLRSQVVNIGRGASTKPEVLALLNEARFGETPTIDDAAYKELSALVETKLEKVQADFLAEAHRDGQEQLVDLTRETRLALIVAGRMTELQAERHKVQLWWADRFDNEMEQWIQDNPDKNKREGYQQAEMVLASYINTPFEEIQALRTQALRSAKRQAETLAGKKRTIEEGEAIAKEFLAEHPLESIEVAAKPFKQKLRARMQVPGEQARLVDFESVGRRLDAGEVFPARSGVMVKRNASDKDVKFQGINIKPGKRVISFDGGKTWRLLP